jgi:hypothetical protein
VESVVVPGALLPRHRGRVSGSCAGRTCASYARAWFSERFGWRHGIKELGAMFKFIGVGVLVYTAYAALGVALLTVF